jgi:hypothetical protein
MVFFRALGHLDSLKLSGQLLQGDDGGLRQEL